MTEFEKWYEFEGQAQLISHKERDRATFEAGQRAGNPEDKVQLSKLAERVMSLKRELVTIKKGMNNEA